MYALEIYGLTKRFGKALALADVSFSVHPGELLAVLGPAGSGKTTLLRLISGLETVDRGSVIVHGRDMTNVSTVKNEVGLLFQHSPDPLSRDSIFDRANDNSYGLVPHLNVFENIAMPLRPGFARKREVRLRVANIAKRLAISHLLDAKISDLKIGERLYVALARSLIKSPSLLLLDDIFLSMDTPTRLETRRVVLALQQAIHLPCLYVTRDQPDAFALADRIILLNNGEVQQIGTRAELINSPATLWVAQWLGFPPMNTVTGVLQGTYQPDGLCYRVWTKGFGPLLPAKWTVILNNLQGKELIVGIRPESIIPEWELQEKWKPSLYVVKAEIMRCDWHHGKTLVQLRLPHAEETFQAVFEIPQPETLQAGQALTIAFDPEQFCLFHPQTQKLLHAPPIPPDLLKKLSGPPKRPFLEKYRPELTSQC